MTPQVTVGGRERPAEDGAPALADFTRQLLASSVLSPSGVDGVWVRSATFERITEAVQRSVTALGRGRYETLQAPPVIARATLERAGYVRCFTDLVGSVHVFRGSDQQHADLLRRCDAGTDWTAVLDPADVMLSSAACHHVYPMCAGRLPSGGRHLEVRGECFRHEPSHQVTRHRSFRMHELVYVGEPEEARAHRDTGLAEGLELLSTLGLTVEATAANDPFFGRAGAILADGQRQHAAKYEGVAPVGGLPTAVMSANYAAEHFGAAFAIDTASGSVAHSSCVAFGLDRVALALLSTHGLDVDRWPSGVRQRLWR